jgi:hypothetical protein
MPTLETPGIAALHNAFPSHRDFPPPAYRGLAMAESEATFISYAGRTMPGFLRPLGLVRAQLTPHYPPHKVEGYMRAIEARHLRLDERLGTERAFRVRAYMGASALEQCTPDTARRIVDLMGRGYEVGFVDGELSHTNLGGPTVDNVTVLLGEGGGVYVYDPAKSGAEKEDWLPGVSPLQARHIGLHDNLIPHLIDPTDVGSRIHGIATSDQ